MPLIKSKSPKAFKENIKAEIAPLRYNDLMAADEAFCTSTAGGIVPVAKFDQ